MSLATRLLGANPGVQVSSALSGSLTTPGAKGAFDDSLNFQLIAAEIVGSTSTTVTFSNISTSYTHLMLMGSARVNNANTNGSFQLRWNGGTSTDSYGVRMQVYKITSTSTYGNSSSISANGVYVPVCGNSATSGTFGYFRVVMPNYKDTDKYRGALVVGGYDTNTVNSGGLDDGTIVQSGTTASTSSRVTSLECYAVSSFLAGSRLHLYGVK